ncbi:hypothetical protein [Streptomyces fradiae]|uniref:hypothetical protein n=1 Tax=Streptomyces fradiae TaxID=1906 RepID=UPI00380EC748
MASGRDEDRRLAEIERLLAREDPDLDARMSALARQLAEDSASPPPHGRLRGVPDPAAEADGTGRERRTGAGRDWRKVVVLVAVVVAVVGLVLTAILSQPSGGAGGGTDPSTPAGLRAPAVTAPP